MYAVYLENDFATRIAKKFIDRFINNMQIRPIPNNSTYPSFKGNRRTIYDNNGKLLYKTTTYFFRDDLNWDDFIVLLGKKYLNTPKVNVINHVCSNGQEPYSLAVKLIDTLSACAEKFFPILARDIDQNNIRSAQNSRMGIKINDIYRINHYTHNGISRYFDMGQAANPENDLVLIPKQNIKDKVIFCVSDIFDDIDSLPSENVILLCRNFWPYINCSKRQELARKLSEKLDETSLLVIGDYDEGAGIGELLEENGFTRTSVWNVFSKRAKK